MVPCQWLVRLVVFVTPLNLNPVTGSGTGFSFGNFSGYWMVQTLEKALDVYENNADAWKQLQHNAMTRDFSWDTASLAYVDLYKQLV